MDQKLVRRLEVGMTKDAEQGAHDARKALQNLGGAPQVVRSKTMASPRHMVGDQGSDKLTTDEKVDLLMIKIDTVINYFKLKELSEEIKEQNDKAEEAQRGPLVSGWMPSKG